MTREEIIRNNPIESFLNHRDIALRGSNGKRTTHVCPLATHKPDHHCVTVDCERNLWNCNDCDKGGSIIDWLMHERGIDAKAVMESFGGQMVHRTLPTPPRSIVSKSGPLGEPVKTYDYTDEAGKLLFQVCRYEPKTFRQRVPNGSAWEYGLGETRRVLYNLPKLFDPDSDFIWLCEGEKDADTLGSFGLVSTTNPMGAEKWMPEYSRMLAQKDVILCPDNDEAGHAHREKLKKELAPFVRALRIVDMPEGIKDVTEFIESFANRGDGIRSLAAMAENAEILYRGMSVPVKTLEEMEREYTKYVERASLFQYDMSRWLPSLRGAMRPLVPGELVSILAGTGVGKTMLLQNMALYTGVETLFIEIELPETLSFERFASMLSKTSGGHVFSMYQTGQKVDWRKANTSNIKCVHLPKLSTVDIERVIENAKLKTGKRPALVMIDYAQLIGGIGNGRYEKTSSVMEELKSIAKSTNTIIVIASQIGRKDKKNPNPEVGLQDGKDSGSIENSSGVVIGAWRDPEDANRLWLRLLKNTKGKAGFTIACRIHDSMQIHEEAKEANP